MRRTWKEAPFASLPKIYSADSSIDIAFAALKLKHIGRFKNKIFVKMAIDDSVIENTTINILLDLGAADEQLDTSNI